MQQARQQVGLPVGLVKANGLLVALRSQFVGTGATFARLQVVDQAVDQVVVRAVHPQAQGGVDFFRGFFELFFLNQVNGLAGQDVRFSGRRGHGVGLGNVFGRALNQQALW